MMCELDARKSQLADNMNPDISKNSTPGKASLEECNKVLSLYSQMFLGLLHTLLAFQNSGASTKLVTVQDMVSVSQVVNNLIERVREPQDSVYVNTAVDRIAQFLQTALAVRALKCHKGN